jgi:hypothetical protein
MRARTPHILTARPPDQDKLIGEVGNVVISDCETLQSACPFLRGFNKSIALDFKPSKCLISRSTQSKQHPPICMSLQTGRPAVYV